MSIIVSQKGKGAQRVERTVIQEEKYLQEYIFDHPDTLPLQDLKDDLKLLVLLREFPTASGPIDALAVDQDGDIYLIETKLYKNPDKRLVIAQVMDYGAALWRASENPMSFLDRVDERLTSQFQVTLSARLTEVFALEGPALSQYMDALKTSVSEGRFRFVVLMDRVDDRLKDLISFINANRNFVVLGIGLDFYQLDGLDILIPTLFGAESTKRATARVAGGRRKWDNDMFFADASESTDAATVWALRELLSWCTSHADAISWGSGARHGSFSAKFASVDPRSILSAYSSGELCLNFGWLNSTPEAVAFAHRLGEALRTEGSLPIPADFMKRWVYFKSDTWIKKVASLTSVLDRHLTRSGHPAGTGHVG